MVASRCCRSAYVALALLVCSGRATAEPRSQAELTCLLDSHELLRQRTGLGAPREPLWTSLGSLQAGHANRARLALASEQAGFLPGLSTSALLRVDVSLDGLGQGTTPTLRDASSFVGIAWQAASAPRLGLRVYPFDTNYLRLGYLHALDWGGTDAGRRDSVFVTPKGSAPGFELSLTGKRSAVYAGLKWATADDALAGPRRLWGAWSGASWDLARAWRLEGGFGYFQRSGHAGAASFVEGASLRLVWHRGAAEPEVAAEPFRPPPTRAEPLRFDAEAPQGFALALEAVGLVAKKRRFESPTSQTLEPAPAAAVYVSVRGARLAGHAALTWRSLPFVLRSDPRVSPDETLPARTASLPELAAWLGGSVRLPSFELVPSFELGARLPAALQAPSAQSGFAQTFVAGGASGFEPLPLGSGRLPLLVARLALRFQASPAVSFSLVADYQRDPNRIRLAATSSQPTRVFAEPDSLTLLAAAQARF